MKRRSFLLVFLLILSVVSVVGASTYGTDLIYGRPSLGTKFLDPHQGGNSGRYQNLNLVYDTLVFPDSSGTIQGLLAQSWEASPDFRDWTFHLRSGVVFHDGTPLTAEAVKFSFDRIVGIGTHTVAAWRFLGPKSTIKVIDDLTVEFIMPDPQPLFLTELCYACYGIISPTAVRAHATQADPWATEYFSTHECGTGPFMYSEYVPSDRLVLAKFDNYWGGVPDVKSAAHVDRLIMRIVPDATTRAVMLQSGELDIAEKLPVDILASLEKVSGIQVEYYPLAAFAELQINCGKSPFDNEDVRKAISHAIDYDAIINGIEQGKVQPLAGLATRGMIGYDATRPRPSYDIDLAKQLMAKAGYANGFDATLIWATERRASFDSEAVLIQQDLAKIGIKLKLQQLAYSAELQKQHDGDFDMALMTYTAGTGDPSQIFDVYLPADNPGTSEEYSLRWNDAPAIVNVAIDYGLTIADPRTRGDLYGMLDDIGAQHAVAFPLYQIPVPFAMRSNVHGFKYTTVGRADFWDATKD